MLNYKCKCCKNDNPGLFVYDACMDDVICTSCGVIQSHMNTSCNNTTFSEPIEIRPPTLSQKKLLTCNDQMMARVCPDEVKEYKRNKLIKEYCEKFDLISSVETRARLLIENNKEELLTIRPIQNLVASCIAIACQSLNRYINIADMEKMFMLTNVNKTLKIVCKVVGINQRAMILNAVPYLVSHLGFPFKYEKILRELYKSVCRKNPSMGAETRMALCCYKMYLDHQSKSAFKDTLTVDYIATLTNTSENSLKTYISGKTKNCLFNANNKRQRENETKKNNNKKIKV